MSVIFLIHIHSLNYNDYSNIQSMLTLETAEVKKGSNLT